MKAMVIRRYGDAGVMEMADLPDPVPAAGELLVEVQAAGMNPVDWKLRRGDLKLVRRLKFPAILGCDLAGTVLAAPGAMRFKPGDRVFGMILPGKSGSFAEKAVVRESATARMPATMSFEEASAIGCAGLTALQGLRDKAAVTAGQSVLVIGASGGVGSFATQIAKALGALVHGVCGPTSVSFVQSLGADRVIDYTREKLADLREKYDVVFDAVGIHSYSECRRLLLRSGIHLTTLPSAGVIIFMGLAKLLPVPKPKLLVVREDSAGLDLLARLFVEKKLRVPIEKVFPLDQLADCMRLSEGGRVKGKLVVRVAGTFS